MCVHPWMLWVHHCSQGGNFQELDLFFYYAGFWESNSDSSGLVATVESWLTSGFHEDRVDSYRDGVYDGLTKYGHYISLCLDTWSRVEHVVFQCTVYWLFTLLSWSISYCIIFKNLISKKKYPIIFFAWIILSPLCNYFLWKYLLHIYK